MENKYQNFHEITIRFLLSFSTTYLRETAFSAMTVLKMKQRSACNFQSPFGYRFNSSQN